CQSSFAKINEPLLSRSSRVGSASASVIPKGVSDGPMARMATVLFAFPVMMNPAMRTLFPLCTRIRVERLRDFAGVAVGVAVGVGVAVAVAVAVGVAVAVAVAVGVAVAVAVAVGVGDGEGAVLVSWKSAEAKPAAEAKTS